MSSESSDETANW